MPSAKLTNTILFSLVLLTGCSTTPHSAFSVSADRILPWKGADSSGGQSVSTSSQAATATASDNMVAAESVLPMRSSNGSISDVRPAPDTTSTHFIASYKTAPLTRFYEREQLRRRERMAKKEAALMLAMQKTENRFAPQIKPEPPIVELPAFTPTIRTPDQIFAVGPMKPERDTIVPVSHEPSVKPNVVVASARSSQHASAWDTSRFRIPLVNPYLPVSENDD